MVRQAVRPPRQARDFQQAHGPEQSRTACRTICILSFVIWDLIGGSFKEKMNKTNTHLEINLKTT